MVAISADSLCFLISFHEARQLRKTPQLRQNSNTIALTLINQKQIPSPMSPPSTSSPTRSWRDAVLGHTAPRPESDSPLAPGRLSYMESPDQSSRIRRPVHHATPPTAGRPPPSIRQRLNVFDDRCADTNNNIVVPPDIFPPTTRATTTLHLVGTPVPTFDPPAPHSTLTSVGDAPSTRFKQRRRSFPGRHCLILRRLTSDYSWCIN